MKRGFVIAALFLCVGSREARAERVEIQTAIGPTFVTSSSFDGVSEIDSFPSGVLAVAVPLLRDFGGTISVDAEYESGEISGNIFGSIETETRIHAFTAGARYSKPLGQRFRLMGRLGLGVVSQRATFAHSSGTSLEDTDALVTMSTAAGGEYLVLRGSHANFGVRVQLAYRMSPSQSVSGGSNSQADTDSMMLSADLGELNMSAWGIRFGAFVSF